MTKIKVLVAGIIVLIAAASFMEKDQTIKVDNSIRRIYQIRKTDPPCIQVYESIEKYSDSFNIPKRYAYGIANTETSYKGPFHWRYKHSQVSCAGAVGPMQVMVSTARWINKDGVSRYKLMNDIEYNVYTSMKLLRILYDKRKDWKLVFGEYNTGRPCINGYAEKVYRYQLNWK
jgi:soluble lytic murein transglycosylase-like protein